MLQQNKLFIFSDQARNMALKRLRRQFIDDPESARQLRQRDTDVQYFIGNYDSLRRQYPDMWVAVYQQHVVGSNKDFKQLARDLRERGLPTGNIFVERTYLNEEPPVYKIRSAA